MRANSPFHPGDLPRSEVFVIGAGPNGLAAAIVMAQAGCSVTVLEAESTAGGSMRSAELTLPGFVHDICSAVFPLAAASPFLRTLPLRDYGLEWVYPGLPLAHPLDDGRAVVLQQQLDATCGGLGQDARAYLRLLSPLVTRWDNFIAAVLAPLRILRPPLALVRFGVNALRPARSLAEGAFHTGEARALLAGLAAHSMLPLESLATAAFALVLAGSVHAAGWPFARGGAQRIADALVAHLQRLGGRLVTNLRVQSLDQLPPARAVLCDVTPRQLLRLAGDRLPAAYRRRLERYRYGMGAFKIDWALAEPIPWRAETCRRAGTIHLGGTLEEIAASERAAWQGRTGPRPFVILAQPSLFDPTRAPVGRHTAWAYCHVPNGSTEDMLERIEAQVERFAPGFRARVLARSVMGPAALERHNENLVGGDINGGAADLPQLFTRPTWRLYGTPLRGLYLCSASTPPGGGVHGMCGYFAAKLALKECFS